MPSERRRVFYSGRVQGVGFRETSRRLARAFAVNGFVKNLPDGRVELVAEGEPATLDALLSAIRSEFSDNIHAEATGSDASGSPPFSDFSIHF